MADAVTSQIIFDGARSVIMKFTNVSDGTGETAAVKVNVSALTRYQGQACTSVNITKLDAMTVGMGVDILWDATTDVVCATLGSDQFISFDFNHFGGITNNAGAGKTGNILFTTVGAALGDRYTVVLEMTKNYG